MSWLRPTTLDGKLKVALILTTSMALLLSLTGIVIGQLANARTWMLIETEALAEVLGANGAAALVFLQPDDAERILSSLAAKPHILAGDFLQPDGSVFASYVNGPRPEVPPVAAMGHAFSSQTLTVRRDVMRDGEKIGEVQLISSLEPVHHQLRRLISLAVFVFGGCALLALWVAIRWLSVISEPIQHLVETADRIATTHDYSLRARKFENDELGRLTDGFNQMLDQIIERQKLEQDNLELVRMKHRLEAQNSELERFAYTVSHDLKSPLITIQGFLGVLEEEAESRSADQVQAIQQIRATAERMQALVDNLLELSRIGRVVNPSCDIDLRSLIEEVVELTGGQISKKKIQVHIAADLPAIRGDLPRLREVFQNLIANAATYMPEARENPLIEIEATRLESEVLCSVRDNGIGIDPEFHDKIFGLFESLHGDSGGTGIGLALVKRIVEHHGGRIWLESEPGRGSTFHFTIKG